jgi:hypothetical protein
MGAAYCVWVAQVIKDRPRLLDIATLSSRYSRAVRRRMSGDDRG